MMTRWRVGRSLATQEDMMTTQDIRGRSALVTGASRGLGRALAAALAAEGARVVMVARGADALAAAVEAIRAAGGEAHAVVADIADKDAVARIAGQAAALVG